MSPRPFSNTLSLKIAAAYYTYFQKICILSEFEISASSDKICYVSLYHENTVVAGG